MEQYKTPDELYSPFNKWSVSNEDKSVTPSSFFKNEHRRLVNMSPNDYFKFVSHQLRTTPEKLMEQRARVPNRMSVDDMQKKMREGTKFDTPWLRVMDRGEPRSTYPYWQEGLHRMLAAGREYGMDTKFPIYLGYENDPWKEMDKMDMDSFIKHYDDTRLTRFNEYKKQEEQEKQERDAYWRKEAAIHFEIPEEQVTQEHVKKYIKYLDRFFRDY